MILTSIGLCNTFVTLSWPLACIRITEQISWLFVCPSLPFPCVCRIVPMLVTASAVNVETISRSSEWAYNLSFFVAASKTFNTDPHVKRAIAYDDWKCVLACRVSRVSFVKWYE